MLPSMLIGYAALCMATLLHAQEKEREPRATLGKAEVSVFNVSPDGKTVATGHGRTTGWVSLWDVSTGKEIGSCGRHNGGVSILAFSPDGKTLASYGGSEVVILSDVTTCKDIRTLKGIPPHRYYSSIAFSPDGKLLATGVAVRAEKEPTKIVAGEVLLWDIATGRSMATYKGFSGPVTSVAFSSDGKTLVTMETKQGTSDGAVKIWDIPGSQVPDR